MSELFAEAADTILRPEVLAAITGAAAWGVFVGAIPGLTATMAVALMVPMTFFMPDSTALAAIVTLEACAIFAGDIPTTLLRIPGTPASAAYAEDAYGLTRQGRAFEALGTALVFSAAGGLFGALVLMVAAGPVASQARNFSSFENFWLTLLGLSCAVVVSRGSALRGAAALLIGLLLATVGLSPVHATPRFTFGRDELISGVNFIPAMIGLFGVSEVLRGVLRPGRHLEAGVAETSARGPRAGGGWLLWRLAEVFGTPLRRLVRRPVAFLRSAAIGSGVGMLPGAGADIGAWISYAVSKRFSRQPDEYGRGSSEGLADATSANNSALAGAWMPALVLGIPGDSVTAIVIGVLMMKDITPGPRILEDQGALVAAIYLTFVLANIVLLPVGFLAIRIAGGIVRLPRRVLFPCILVFSVVGAYAIGGNYFDVWVMLGMGLLGFALEAVRAPLGPVVLGVILGGQLEETFVQSWKKAQGDPSTFFARPWAAVLGAVTLLVWFGPPVFALWRRARTRRRTP